MTLRVSRASAQKNRMRLAATKDRGSLWHTTYMGTNQNIRGAPGRTAKDDQIPDDLALYPMAFLVEQDADTEASAHFHQANQFQVVVAGNGWLGTHPLGCLAVHYVNAYTPYGPIVAGHAGLHYFTLRNGWDPGARRMPGARADLRAARRNPRQAVSDLVPRLAPAALAACSKSSTLEMLAPQPDGLSAVLHRIPAAGRIVGQRPHGGGGQFWLVLAGSLEYSDCEPFDALSCAFVFPGDAPFEATAGANGLEMLYVQFPLHVTL